MSSKISGYAAITSVQTDDLLPVVDVHDTSMAASGTTKRMTLSQLPFPALLTQTIATASALTAGSAPVVLTDTTSAAFTLTLPASPTAGSSFVVIDDMGQWNTHNLTIGRNAHNIDGAAANLTLANQWGKVWLYFDGTAWWSLAAGPSNETPAMDGAASAGTHVSASRADHVHPTDTSRAAAAGGAFTGAVIPAVSALTDGATISVNAALGNVFTVTLGGNRTLANPTNPVAGQAIQFHIAQDGTGSRTLSYGTAYDFGTAGSPVLTTTASKMDVLGFVYDGGLSKWCYLGSGLGF